ncbi:MAG: R3H domain-containing nucleic acid-binding protein [Candidatus Bipolaricaulota bacterium]|nr:R3H domain-containing nucleic acid-binding protein [Candidatus Bipolaricaulota bacterium]
MDPKILQAIEAFLQGLFQIAGETALFQIRPSEEGLYVDLQGAQVFVGSNQRALRALAHLVEIYIKRTLDMDIAVHIDADGYRERRRAELRALALQWAEEALREHKKIVLDPMEPYERKAIHEALSAFPGVRTYSEGQGEERRVVIEPT